MKYIKQLDSVRAIAVLLVMISHWVPPYYFINRIPNGGLGVDIFFVLSGFLITWILLGNRKKAELENSGKGSVIRTFYFRRTIRIFPIYYLVVLGLIVLHRYTDSNIGSTYGYYLTYTSNFYMFSLGKWEGIGMVSHLWSLAVEEQFYLLWPALMLFIPRKYLLHVIYIFIGIGVLSQVLLINHPMGPIMTSACFQAFGVGALLAWHLVYHEQGLEKFYKAVRALAIVAFIFFVAGVAKPEWNIFKMFREISSVLGIFIITHLVYKGRTGNIKLGFIWNNRVLIFLGKISYGLYLYHNIIPHFSKMALEKVGISIESFPYKLGYIVMIGINFVLVVGVAWLSWNFIEKPILSLKRYFEYVEKGETKPQVTEGVTNNDKVRTTS